MTSLDPVNIESRNERLQLQNASRSTRVTETQPQRTVEPNNDDASRSYSDLMLVPPNDATELVPPPPKVKR